MPRAIWSGTVSFGLVSVPVRMFSAVSEDKLHFNLLHRKDESPIGYEKICKLEGKPVPDGESVKAYEIQKGEFVYVEDEDFEAAQAAGGRAFEIAQFVEKYRAGLGTRLEPSLAIAYGACERAAAVTEQLRLHQRRRQGRDVDRKE